MHYGVDAAFLKKIVGALFAVLDIGSVILHSKMEYKSALKI